MKRAMMILLSFVLIFALCIQFLSTEAYAADFPANSVTKEGYTLDFQEEFNGTSLDTTKWTNYYLPHWCDDPSTAVGNYRFEDGCLIEYITEDQAAWCPEHDGSSIGER